MKTLATTIYGLKYSLLTLSAVSIALTLGACGETKKSAKLKKLQRTQQKPTSKSKLTQKDLNTQPKKQADPQLQPTKAKNKVMRKAGIQSIYLKPYSASNTKSSRIQELVYLNESEDRHSCSPQRDMQTTLRLKVQQRSAKALPTWITCVENIEDAALIPYNGIIIPMGSAIMLQRKTKTFTSQRRPQPKPENSAPFIKVYCTQDGLKPEKASAPKVVFIEEKDERFERFMLQKDNKDFYANVEIQLDSKELVKFLKSQAANSNFRRQNLTQSHYTSVDCYRKRGVLQQIYGDLQKDYHGIHLFPGSQVVVSLQGFEHKPSTTCESSEGSLEDLMKQIEEDDSTSDSQNTQFKYFVCLPETPKTQTKTDMELKKETITIEDLDTKTQIESKNTDK